MLRNRQSHFHFFCSCEREIFWVNIVGKSITVHAYHLVLNQNNTTDTTHSHYEQFTTLRSRCVRWYGCCLFFFMRSYFPKSSINFYLFDHLFFDCIFFFGLCFALTLSCVQQYYVIRWLLKVISLGIIGYVVKTFRCIRIRFQLYGDCLCVFSIYFFFRCFFFLSASFMVYNCFRYILFSFSFICISLTQTHNVDIAFRVVWSLLNCMLVHLPGLEKSIVNAIIQYNVLFGHVNIFQFQIRFSDKSRFYLPYYTACVRSQNQAVIWRRKKLKAEVDLFDNNNLYRFIWKQC